MLGYLPELLAGCLDLLARFFPGVGHWTVMVLLTSGQSSLLQVSWKSVAVTVEVGTAARSAMHSSVSMVCEEGKVMSLSCAWPTISRMGRNATPKPSPGFSLGKYSMRKGSLALKSEV